MKDRNIIRTTIRQTTMNERNPAPPVEEPPAMQHAAAAYSRGDWRRAEQLCRSILNAQADRFDALNLLGIIAAQTHRTEEAAHFLGRASALKANDAVACNNYGNVLRDLKRWAEALDSYERALTLKPDYAEAYLSRGNVLKRLQRLEDALESYEQALKIKPDYAEVYNNRGTTLKSLKRLDDALDSYEQALKIKPNYAEAYYNRANVLREQGRLGDALASYEQARNVRPDLAEIHNNIGNTLKELKRFDDALDSYEWALAIRPDYAETHNNRGVALKELQRLDDALASHDRALTIKPGDADGHFNRGNVLLELRRPDAALESYERALKIEPDFAEAYNNRGTALSDLKRYEFALQSYERALELNPDCEWLYGSLLYTKIQLCEWSHLDDQIAKLVANIKLGRKAAAPGVVLTLVDSPPLQRRAAQIWVEEKCAINPWLPPIGKYGRHEKIRIGYFSADFRNHPVSLLTAELIETHSRSRFEVSAFSFGPDTQDGTRKRMERAFDRFVEVRGKADVEVVRLARSMELDIAVDLGGFTEGCRANLFALRSAPVQLSYLGFLGTLGADYMDYLIADPTIVPVEQQAHYAEKIVYLPSYQANESKRLISERRFTREELGLPRTGFVFCCFNANYKIMPGTFDGWMRILSRVPGSVLFLFAGSATVERNLRKEALKRGVDAQRLVFGKRLAVPEYLARYRSADLFLDTLPHNAGTTASDALWAGLPVLTLMGESFAARVAASLLNAIRLPELITTTQAHYEARAIELASDAQQLAQLREKLNRNRSTTPLFDTGRFSAHIENAYTQIYERHHAGLSPEHISVN
jgi:predicted O-linked N-acetylglucosamine transferase (SPINDLY family)